MRLLSLLTHPQVVPNRYEFLSSVKHKRSYLKEYLALTSIGGKTMNVNGSLVTNIFQNVFCVQQRKETHTGFGATWG